MSVPVFDAREVALDASVDFDKLDKTFPRFEGEIPVGSCVGVGHSLTSYPGKKIGDGDTTMRLGTNLLFAIVFGVFY
jgi:hypothetical protein